jgi:GDPmannose 4,6-dehydratase
LSEQRTTIIIGAGGQDGTLLSRLLAARGDRVVAVYRDGPFDITRSDDVLRLVGSERPDEIYFLAAVHHSSQDSRVDPVELARRSYEVNTLPVVYFLEAIHSQMPRARLFYAASSHVFGEPTAAPQDESTPLQPTSIYGITKLAGMMHCRAFRLLGVFAAVGILYTHESPLRPEKFVASKIARTAVRIQRGEASELVLGRLSASGDWGYAPDYVEAMTRILAADEPDDFIVASGEQHTVKDIVTTAFDMLGLDWRRYVREDAGLLSRQGPTLVGDASRLRRATGWRPTVDFRGLVRALLEAEGAEISRD